MLPIILDGSMVRAGIAGQGDALARRLLVMKAGGVDQPVIFTDRLPNPGELADLQILFIAGLSADVSRSLAGKAREAGLMVNVEDVPELCDFHMPAQVRRGDLLLAISTAGRSPALSRALREYLEVRFGPEWEGRLETIADLRQQWRAAGVAPDEVSARTRAHLAEQGWLP
jgi:precorrin-2 dehydrogenase / sirohydrochlorin ferrochelatase